MRDYKFFVKDGLTGAGKACPMHEKIILYSEDVAWGEAADVANFVAMLADNRSRERRRKRWEP